MNMYLRQRVNAYVCVFVYILRTFQLAMEWQFSTGECCRNGRCSMAMFEYC